jgi:hypothetical protein
MTTFLFSLMLLTAGGDRMAVTDPHGWTLTIISVSCVFTALIILYFIYIKHCFPRLDEAFLFCFFH